MAGPTTSDLYDKFTVVEHAAPSVVPDVALLAYVDLSPDELSGQVEQVWLDGETQRNSSGTPKFRVCCISNCAYGLALGDEVELRENDCFVGNVVTKSGNAVFRFLVIDSPETNARSTKLIEAVNDELDRLGLKFEVNGDRDYAVNVPPGGDIEALEKMVEQGEKDGLLEYEWSSVHAFERPVVPRVRSRPVSRKGGACPACRKETVFAYDEHQGPDEKTYDHLECSVCGVGIHVRRYAVMKRTENYAGRSR